MNFDILEMVYWETNFIITHSRRRESHYQPNAFRIRPTWLHEPKLTINVRRPLRNGQVFPLI